jgi:hypothetical protein
MKQEITGYITGMINSYERTIDQYEKDELPKEKYKKFDLVKEELSDLLDFVQNIPEEKHEPVIINNSADFEKIKSYARKLEKINADLREENQKLTTQIKINERISRIRKKDIEEINARNSVIGQKNEQLRLDNISWQKACNELKETNEFLGEQVKGLKDRFGI